ncbi:hypothetical protein [Streptomyces sp. NPDC058874]|uniref:hypothetical protein n=1 Tax=unclassified Streptomyces TaxID=2593676 RepID=UPI0036BE3315
MTSVGSGLNGHHDFGCSRLGLLDRDVKVRDDERRRHSRDRRTASSGPADSRKGPTAASLTPAQANREAVAPVSLS